MSEVQLTRFSITELERWYNDPFEYFIERFVFEKIFGIRKPPDEKMLEGTFWHEVFYRAYLKKGAFKGENGYSKEGIRYDLRSAYSDVAKEWLTIYPYTSKKLGIHEDYELNPTHRLYIEKFAENEYERRNDGKRGRFNMILFAEELISIKIDVDGTMVEIRGRPDRVDEYILYGKKHYYVYDYKSRSDSDVIISVTKEDKRYIKTLQLPFYALALSKKLNTSYENVYCSYIDYMGETSEPKLDSQKRKRRSDILHLLSDTKFEEFIAEIVRNIKKCYFPILEEKDDTRYRDYILTEKENRKEFKIKLYEKIYNKGLNP